MSLTWTYLVPDLYFPVIILRVYFILLKNVDAYESKIQLKGDFQIGCIFKDCRKQHGMLPDFFHFVLFTFILMLI